MFGGTISETEFFTDYWRRKPCLFRNAVRDLPDVSFDRLLGLLAHPIVESRLILSDFSLQLGPFSLSELPPAKGLLMLNGLDQHLTEIDTMLQRHFAFLPRWRVDDVMASIGGAAASAGPHFDHYDVFLLQHSGSKTWQLDSGGHEEDELDTRAEIRLLPMFEPDQQIEVGPGDLLYLPPGVGHCGINTSDSVTLSIGIRNPAVTELLSDLTDFIIDNADNGETIDDNMQAPNSGISSNDATAIRSKLNNLLADDQLIADWYGSYSTRLREPELAVASPLKNNTHFLFLAPHARLTWFEQQDSLRVYANGITIVTTRSALTWLRTLSADRQCAAPADPEGLRVLGKLASAGMFTES